MRALVVALLVVLGAEAQEHGVFMRTRDRGDVPLLAYAEPHLRGMLRMTNSTLEDAPPLTGTSRFRCSIPGWRPVSAIVATDAILADERAERRIVAFATRRLNIYATEIRIADLEKDDTIAQLQHSVGASADRPAYLFIGVQAVEGGVVRYYPARLHAAP